MAGRASILRRIRHAMRRGAYLVPTAAVPTAQREALAVVARGLAAEPVDPDELRARIDTLFVEGRIDAVMRLSALGVVAASPAVRDLREASRLAGQQELAALELGGPWRDAYLASADRHRGVIAFLAGRDVVALDWFAKALERQRSPENVGNVLAVLIRLGELAEAHELLVSLRGVLPAEVWADLQARIDTDDDLARMAHDVWLRQAARRTLEDEANPETE